MRLSEFTGQGTKQDGDYRQTSWNAGLGPRGKSRI